MKNYAIQGPANAKALNLIARGWNVVLDESVLVNEDACQYFVSFVYPELKKYGRRAFISKNCWVNGQGLEKRFVRELTRHNAVYMFDGDTESFIRTYVGEGKHMAIVTEDRQILRSLYDIRYSVANVFVRSDKIALCQVPERADL